MSAPVEAPPGAVVHEVDGIREEDNVLPRWWLFTLYGAIVFGVAYWFAYHELLGRELPMQAWRREVNEAAERSGKSAPVSADLLEGLARDGTVVAEGRQVFSTTCAACHGPTGGGAIGPNLTDGFWLHGGTPERIHATVRNGAAANGMPAWGPQLGEARVQAVVAYVLTLRNTNAPGGKAPQGEPFAANP